MATPWRSSRFWVRAASLAVTLSVALALAHLTWRLVGWDDGRSLIATPDRLAPVGGAASDGLTAITALAPFGGAAVSGNSGLPPTSLPLQLKGVVYSSAPSASSALIATGPGPALTFHIGEAPIGNAVIDTIEMDYVVLNVGGRREALAFPQLTSATADAPGAGPIAVSPEASSASTVSPEGAAALAAASPIASALAARNAAAATPPRPTPQVDPAAAMSAAGVSATRDGYRLGPDAPEQLLRAGLKPGDLIRSLNGQPVGNLQSDQQLFERAAAAGSARVEIIRDGRSLTLTFPLR